MRGWSWTIMYEGGSKMAVWWKVRMAVGRKGIGGWAQVAVTVREARTSVVRSMHGYSRQ